MLEQAKHFLHAHPIESTIIGGVAVIALYIALKPAPAASNSGEAALQNAYFQAEGIQAQSNAAVQVASITTSAQTAQTQIAADASTATATTYANEQTAINSSNNNAAIASLPYQTENSLIQALLGVAGQTQSSSSSSGGFFGIGAGTKTSTGPTPAASSAAEYLSELVNGLHASNG